jgi:hypothetical protein
VSRNEGGTYASSGIEKPPSTWGAAPLAASSKNYHRENFSRCCSKIRTRALAQNYGDLEGGYKGIPWYSVRECQYQKVEAEEKITRLNQQLPPPETAMRVPSTSRPGLAALGFGQ